MGYAEEAKVQLAAAKESGDPVGLAQIYATLAVVDSVDALQEQINYLSDLVRENGTPTAT